MSRHLLRSWRALLASAWMALAVLSGCEPFVAPGPGPSPCATNNGGCAANAICSASLGATDVTCACPANFVGDGHTCTPGSVCDDNNGGCDANATCTSVNKSARCTCNEGFEGDGSSCTAIDVCQVNNGGCGTALAGSCRSENGHATCTCNDGYAAFGTTCVPACEVNNGGCGPNAICSSGATSVDCTCGSGYQKKGKNCVADPCAMDNGQCGTTEAATCTSTAGVATCQCRPGNVKQGTICVDECTTFACTLHAVCGHAADNATVCTCEAGYLLTSTGTCAQDPCVNNGGCGTVAAAQCSGTPTTGPICTCNAGYRRETNGVRCIDPCEQNNGGCGGHASCDTNPTTGNPVCTCLPGWEVNGSTCVLDPCTVNNGGCGSPTAASCTSSRGAASCACRSGYTNNLLGVCVDVCLQNNGGCQAHSDCTHAPQDSTVQCTCSEGFQLKNGTCVADPCLTNNGGCGSTSIASCSSSAGVATCTCATGYAVSGGTCVDACTVSGSCQLNSSCSHAADYSLVCTCNSGYLPNGNACYANQCLVSTACDPSEDCTPHPSGRTCACKANYVPDTAGGHCKARVSVIAAGGNHLTCATSYDGKLRCAGNGAMGPLVSAGSSAVHSFVGVTGSWQTISAGTKDVCGIDDSGTLKCWHQPTTGAASATPAVVGAGETWKEVSVSLTGGFACAVHSDNSLWCWGANVDGQLGQGDKLDKAAPTRVGIGTRWASISTGQRHTCGVQTDGSLWCWGSNAQGELGTGSGDAVFETLVGGDFDWASVSAGADQTCAVKTDGTLYCWGCQGLDTACWPHAAAPTLFGGDHWSAISAGGTVVDGPFVCGVHTDGTAWCWGDDTFGQLANGVATTAYHANPSTQTRVGALVGVDGIKAGVAHACASRDDGTLHCWGDNLYGQSGDGTDGATPVVNPKRLPGVDWWHAVPSNSATACALNNDQALLCWGDNPGTIGDGTEADQSRPTREAGGAAWSEAATGGGSCAVQSDKSLWCWGRNTYGELGSGATPGTGATSVPLQITADKTWDAVCTGLRHACALKSDHTLWCWGDDTLGQLGLTVPANSRVPTQVDGVTWDSVSCGDFHTCATQTDGSLWCWGDNSDGQLGTTTSLGQFVTTPSRVGLGTSWVEVSAGGDFSCGRQTGKTLWCWGSNAKGQLGQGSLPTSSTTPLQVGSNTSWEQISTSGTNACAFQTAGALFCWGSNTGSGGVGMLGSNDLASHEQPVQVVGGAPWSSVAVGAGQTCATQNDNSLWCWGSNTSGQLGDGATTKTSPVRGF